jgi:hypothetical protein
VPQTPQLNGSLSGLVQPPLQLVRPALHPAAQTPKSQTEAASHAVAQVPQFWWLPWSDTQAPPQSLRAPWQRHTATWQDCPVEHWLPQPPQLSESEEVLTHEPLQAVRPAPQLTPPLVLVSPPVLPGEGVGLLDEQLTASVSTASTSNKRMNFNWDFIRGFLALSCLAQA